MKLSVNFATERDREVALLRKVDGVPFYGTRHLQVSVELFLLIGVHALAEKRLVHD
jgi:hypothetical protein